MQLVDLGRNAPCPCGSGRKHKKCCLQARVDALAATDRDINPAAIVDEAIETDDWGVIHDLVDRALEAFDIGGPLEHVRFRDDLIGVHDPDVTELTRLCTPGWLARCELEIVHVLTRFELEPEVRDALRMAVHLVRRFGPRSPIVEELASLQAAECAGRRRRLVDTMSSRGVTLADMKSGTSEIESWLERARPSILSFAEWFALRVTPETSLETIWLFGISRSICETCVDRLEHAPADEARLWAALAGVVMLPGMAPIGGYLVHETPLRDPTHDEQMVYALLQHRQRHEGLEGILHDILRATESRSDFAGAALIRETMRVVQSWSR